MPSIDSRARSTSWSCVQSSTATPTIGQSSRPRASSRYNDRNVITFARSPVIPKTTRTSAGRCSGSVVGAIVRSPRLRSFVRHGSTPRLHVRAGHDPAPGSRQHRARGAVLPRADDPPSACGEASSGRVMTRAPRRRSSGRSARRGRPVRRRLEGFSHGRRPALRRRDHRHRCRRGHPRAPARHERREGALAGTWGLPAPGAGQLGDPGGVRPREVPRARGLVRRARPRVPARGQLLRRRQHQVLRGGAVPAATRGLRRAASPRRHLPGLADLLRRPGALLHPGRAPVPRARRAR